MATGTYNMLLVEAPNVPANEISSAVRWRIKDLIDYPIDETVIEILDMPEQSNPGHKPMVYAVVTQKASVQQQVDIVKQSGLAMDIIDIPELCLRNIAVSLPQDRSGLAFLHFTESQGFLTITKGGVLYLVRHIGFGRDSLDSTILDDEQLRDAAGKIALELQRSLDYYESHYDCPPVGELLVGPGAGLDKLAGALAEELGVAVKEFDLDEMFDVETPISVEEQGNCMLAIGAALRSGQEAA
jgi:MSHA biogenesis protein MshI